MKKLLALILALAMIFTLAACAKTNDDTTDPTTAPSGEAPSGEAPAPTDAATDAPDAVNDADTLICIVSESAQGAPFSQQTWLGFENVQKAYGTQIKFVEALEASEYETQLRAMADAGAKVIFSMFDAVNLVAAEIAPEYPDVHFVLIDCNQTFDIDNVTCIVVDSWEPSFVAGVVAALSTESGVVGWVGSLDIPVITRFYDGYAAGVDYANQTFGLKVTAEKTYVGDAEDTVKAYEATKMLISKGADIVYQAANEAGLGVINACADNNIRCIGVDKWQGDINDCVFWSAVICIEQGVFNTYDLYREGKLTGGSISYGIANDFPIYADVDYEKLPDNVKEAVDTVMAGVKDGTLDVFAYGNNG